MKSISVYIMPNVLTNCSFRSKVDIISACIRFVKFAPISYNNENDLKKNATLIADKMKRLFIVFGNSIHSFQFPFNISVVDGKLSFGLFERELDSKTTSFLLGYFERAKEIEAIEDLYDEYLKILDEYDIHGNENEKWFWKIIYELMLFEPAYVRYDNDYEPSRFDPEKHQQYHLDLNYSNTSTFKLGLKKEITLEEFISILNNKDKSWQLNN